MGNGRYSRTTATPTRSPVGVQRIDRLAYRAGARAHQHDHPIGVGRAVVVDEVVLAAGQRGEAVHRRLHDVGHARVERVARLAGLEEHVGVLRAAAQHRAVGVEPAVAGAR